jgi:hypothetical protein
MTKQRLIWLVIVFVAGICFEGVTASGAAEEIVGKKIKSLMSRREELLKHAEANKLDKVRTGQHPFQNKVSMTGIHPRADIVVSDNPEDLERLSNTAWFCGYQILSFYALEFHIDDSDVEINEDGYATLSWHDRYEIEGVMLAYRTDPEADTPMYVFMNEDENYSNHYEVEFSGNIVNGYYWLTAKETGKEYGPYEVKGFKWGSTICDKNNDDKLGMAEAIHYLKVAAGQ